MVLWLLKSPITRQGYSPRLWFLGQIKGFRGGLYTEIIVSCVGSTCKIFSPEISKFKNGRLISCIYSTTIDWAGR